MTSSEAMLVVQSVLFVAAAALGVWAMETYSERPLIAAAVMGASVASAYLSGRVARERQLS